MRKLKVAVVGATGVVGRELVRVLEEREFPVGELVALASERSAGQELEFRDGGVRARKLGPGSFDGVDLALFAAGPAVAKEFAPFASQAGAVVVDTSAAFRLDPEVPLVVPEVNPEALLQAVKPGGRRTIASPNCAVMLLALALKPLHQAAGLVSVDVATYQSVSGAGQAGIDELETQSRALFNLGEVTPSRFPHRIAFNLLPELGAAAEGGYTEDELKLVHETRRILGLPALRVMPTCVRVPVFYCHSAAVTARFSRPLPPAEARALLAKAPGVKVVDDLKEHVYPMPLLGAGDDATLIGRLRTDLTDANGLALFATADNLRKAATNAVLIAELLLRDFAGSLASLRQ